jgi:alpha-glucosidase
MQDWWRGAVTYQIYPRSFQDGNGDGSGDLRGITRRLPYLADLGVDAVWLSPIFPSPMADMGYDVADYTDIDPLFGSLADFDAMVAEAHRLGLKVIIDQVLNHCSIEHPFFRESRRSRNNPKADWFVWADPRHDGTPPNNWLSCFGGPAWTWEPRRHQYYLHNFLSAQPDWNFHNPDVQDWLLEQMRFWLDRGVDGFRLDTVNFYFHDRLLRDNPASYRRLPKPHWNPYEMQYHLFSKNQPENIAFLERMRALLDEYEARALVGEMGETHHAIRMMGEYTTGRRLHKCYSFEMMSEDFSPAHFRAKVEEFFAEAPQGWPTWAFSNHDVPATSPAGRSTARAPRRSPSFPRRSSCRSRARSASIRARSSARPRPTSNTTNSTTRRASASGPTTGAATAAARRWSGTPASRTQASPKAAPGSPSRRRRPPAQSPGRSAGPTRCSSSTAGCSACAARTEALRTGRTAFLDAPEPVLAFTRGGEVLCVFNLSPERHAVRLTAPASRRLTEGSSIAARRSSCTRTASPSSRSPASRHRAAVKRGAVTA